MRRFIQAVDMLVLLAGSWRRAHMSNRDRYLEQQRRKAHRRP